MSLMKFSEPSLWTKPQTTRSPAATRDPVRKKNPDSCQGVDKTDAIGWLSVGADGRWRLRGGLARVDAHTGKVKAHHDLPRFRALVWR